MGYVLLGTFLAACIVVATAAVWRRAARGWGYWGARRTASRPLGDGAYRSARISGTRRLRAPTVALVAAWSATVLACASVPAALLALAVSGFVGVSDGTASAIVLACAAPVALGRALLGARGALGLLDADLGRVARARAETRWELLFDALLVVALVVSVAASGRGDLFVAAGLVWACTALGQALLLAYAARVVGARLSALVIPRHEALTPSFAAP